MGGLHGRESPASAFRAVNKSNWTETCLDNIPLRKRHNSSGSDRSDGRHKMMSPDPHHGQNGYSPIKAEMAAAQLRDISSPSPSHKVKKTPPPVPQRKTEIRKNSKSKQAPPPPRRTTSQKSSSGSPLKRQTSLPSQSTVRMQQQKNASPNKIPHKVSPVQNNHEQNKPIIPTSIQNQMNISNADKHNSLPPMATTSSSPTPQDKLRVNQLKEQYAKLRQLQRKHDEERYSKPGLQETDIDALLEDVPSKADDRPEDQQEPITDAKPKDQQESTTDDKPKDQEESTATNVELTEQVAPATTEVTNQH